MPEVKWRPASEAEAVSAQAVFIAWLHTLHGIALDGPAGLAAWRRDAPAAFAAAISEFASLPLPWREGTGGGGHLDVRGALLRGQGNRTALLVLGATERRSYSRAELWHATTLPEPIETMLAALTLADLPALAASHLLDAGTCPDTRLFWAGEPTQPWPLGAWLVGATVVLGEIADAAPVRAAPAGWRG